MSIWFKLGTAVVALIVLFEVYSQYSDNVVSLERDIAFAQSQMATLDERYDTLLAEKAAAEAASSQAPALWIAEDEKPPIGTAQSTLAQLTTEIGIDLKGLQAGDIQELGGFKAMRMVLEVEADAQELQNLLQRVHQNTPTILPVAAEIRRLNRGAGETTYPETLVRLTLDMPYVPQEVLQ